MTIFNYSYNTTSYSTLAGWDACPSLDAGGSNFHRSQEQREPYQSNSGPARTWRTSARHIGPYVGPSILQPTRGSIPETAANAEYNQSNTEGVEGTGSKPPRKANGTGKSRNFRKREQQDFRELRALIKRWKDLHKLPTQSQALKDALEYVQTVRVAVYQRPHLKQKRRESKSPSEGSAHAKSEREARDAEREVFKELSRFYPLEMDDGENSDVCNPVDGEGNDEYEPVWNRPSLLKEVLEDLKFRCPPPELSTSSAH